MISLEIHDNINHIKCNDYSLRIIDFTHIINSIIILSFLNDCAKYSVELKGIKKLTSDLRKLIKHNLIFEMCEHILKFNGGYKSILFFHKNSLNLEHYNELSSDLIKKLELLISNEIRKIQKLLPIVIHTASHTDFNRFHQGILDDSGYLKSKLSELNQKIENLSNTDFSFSKCKKEYEKSGLTFLSREYFNNIKTKMVLTH